MLVSEFDFKLPHDRIAVAPANPRESARLLDLSGTNPDKLISDFCDLLEPDDLLIFNDTKVIPAQLEGKRGDAKISVTLHKNISTNRWQVFAKPAKKLKIGDIFVVSSEFSAVVIDKNEGEVLLEFNKSSEELYSALSKFGSPPLPPYIERKSGATDQDKEDYQTIYAEHLGAVAAPTAGLHFTKDMFDKIEKKGIKKAFVTLHVGAGTFLPVKAENTNDHKMHSEYCVISEDVANLICETKKNGGRIVAVGTTSLRLLESAATDFGKIAKFEGDTNIFITPGYHFKIVDALLTNFHLPKSTLFMLVSAFAGFEKMRAAYEHAIEQKYRFYSYGDACFLIKK